MLRLFKIFVILSMSPTNNAGGFHIREELAKSLSSVIHTYFKQQTLFVVFDKLRITAKHSGLEPNLNLHLRQNTVKRLQILSHWTLQISSTDRVEPFDKEFPPVKLENTIIFLHEQTISNDTKFLWDMINMKINPFWSPYGKTLVLTEKFNKTIPNKEWAKKVIEKIWSVTRNDDILVMVANRKRKGIEFYTWFPYRWPDCSNVENVVLLDTWIDGHFEWGVNLYPDKITYNLKGCELKVVTDACIPYVIPENFSLPNEDFTDGIEIRMINSLAKAMNFTIEYAAPPENFYELYNEESQLTGAFKMLRYQKVDVAFSCMMLSSDRWLLAEGLPSYFDDSLIWFVPTPRLKSHLADLYYAFPAKFWFCILIAFASCFILIVFISRVEGRILKYKKHSPMSYAIKLSGMSFSTAVVFDTPSILVRTFIFFFCIYSTHLTTAFQASLFTLFRTTDYEKPITTLQQAVDANLYAYLRESTKKMYNTSDHEIWNKIFTPGRYEYYQDQIFDYFDAVGEEKNAMILFIKSQGLYIVYKWYTTKLGAPQILYIKDRFSSYPVTMYMSPGSPLLPVFESMIYRLIASGLVDYWSKKVSQQKTMNKNRFNVVKNTPLSLEHFSGAFYLHFGMSFISVLIFICELLIHKFFKVKRTSMEEICKKRTENIVCRNNYWIKENDLSETLNDFLYTQIKSKGKKEKFY